jgi:competence protein ComEA
MVSRMMRVTAFAALLAVTPAVAAQSAPVTAAKVALVAVNVVGVDELVALPRIGPALAQRIVDYRKANGPFRQVDDLAKVAGIGPKLLEQLRPLVTAEVPIVKPAVPAVP